MKTARPSPRSGVALPLGAHPGNTGGKPGRSGRKPDAFRLICRQLATSTATLAAVRAILADSSHPAFIGALKWATEHGYGKAQQSVDLTSGGKSFIVEVPPKVADSAAWARSMKEAQPLDTAAWSKRYGPNGDKQR